MKVMPYDATYYIAVFALLSLSMTVPSRAQTADEILKKYSCRFSITCELYNQHRECKEDNFYLSLEQRNWGWRYILHGAGSAVLKRISPKHIQDLHFVADEANYLISLSLMRNGDARFATHGWNESHDKSQSIVFLGICREGE